ncbi:MAG: PaaI family thioesterase, partial [Nocardioides sp.]
MTGYDPEHHFLAQLGMYDVEVPEDADLAMALPVHARVTNPRGGLQGGLIATLIDVTAGRAALAAAGESRGVPTSDMHIRFLSAVTVGPAVAVARVLRTGRTQIILQVDVHDEGRDV